MAIGLDHPGDRRCRAELHWIIIIIIIIIIMTNAWQYIRN